MSEDFFFDKPISEPLYQESKQYYSDEFIKKLGDEFSFDVINSRTLSALYEIPFRYNLANRIAAGDKELGDQRKPYLKVQKKLHAFLKELEEQGGEYFNLEVFHGARALGELDPNLYPLDYPDQAFSTKQCYWFEFERYLKCFDKGLESTN